jgi:hypothetical protein
MRHFSRLLLALGLIALVSGCARNKIETFAGSQQPKLVLEDYFQGRTYAYGIFEDRFGKLRREFKVTIDGSVSGNVLTLDERFEYADGAKERRVWRLTRTGPSTYEGRADDVIGVAKGQLAGNAFRFQYRLNLKVGDSVWPVTFDDWMYLQTDGVLLNRATIKRWGLEIGTVTLAFVRPADLPKATP